MDDFFTKLKSATQPMHKAVEKTAISMAIMSPALDTAIYTEYLCKTLWLHRSIESIVFSVVAPAIDDLEARRKSGLIMDDLAHLSYRPGTPGMQLTDDAYRPDLPFNLGMLYVSEGSMLGGQYILRHVKQVLGPGAPVSFLNGYGQNTGSAWKHLLSQLDTLQLAMSEQERDAVFSGAMYAFERVYHIFNADIHAVS